MNRAMFVLVFGLAAVTAEAQPRAAAAGAARPELFEALVRCRSIAGDAARLACFDTAAARLQQAAERRDLVVVDRAQVRESRRRLFGLSLPSLPIFGGGGDDDDEEEVDHIESRIASASDAGMGRFMVRLEDGSSWLQTDNQPMAVRPRRGDTVRVSRAALGTFMMRVGRQPAVRVRRVI